MSKINALVITRPGALKLPAACSERSLRLFKKRSFTHKPSNITASNHHLLMLLLLLLLLLLLMMMMLLLLLLLFVIVLS